LGITQQVPVVEPVAMLATVATGQTRARLTLQLDKVVVVVAAEPAVLLLNLPQVEAVWAYWDKTLTAQLEQELQHNQEEVGQAVLTA
jgi:hypothetical protein